MMRSWKETDLEAPPKEARRETVPRNAEMRDKRARSLAAMGLVARQGSHYVVRGASLRGQRGFEVTRDPRGRVVCSCEEFNREVADNPGFRCEHILAVKYSLAPPQEEAAEEPPSLEAAGEEEAIESEEEKNNVEENEKEPAMETPFNAAEFADTLRTLRRPIDSRLIKSREGWTDRQGDKHWVEYIEWHTVADILDQVAPSWSHAVRNIVQVGDVVAVTAAITIDGVTREGIGTGSADNETGIKKAEHDALKRAAVKFGIARDLYQRESEGIDRDGAATALPREARARNASEQATGKQVWMIRAIGRDSGVDVEQECLGLFECKVEELSKRAASALIDYLKRRQQEGEELKQAS